MSFNIICVIDERRNLKSRSILRIYFVLFLIEKCVVQSIVVKYLVEANFHLAVPVRIDYSSDTINRLNFKEKLEWR